jgi:hypothetical protein
LSLLFFRIEHIILTAKPGEIVTVSNIPSVGVFQIPLGGRDVVVDYRSVKRPYFTGYWCEDDNVIFNEDFSPNDDITVKNDCSETLSIEVYSYVFRVLNGILDASNGGLIEGYEESPIDD